MYIEGVTRRRQQLQAGISLIELIMFIVIVSVGLAGVLAVMNVTARASADPLERKQALAIAEAMLEEVSLMPFTTCDPDGFVSETLCSQAEVMGPEGGSPAEARGNLAAPFDNVNDYKGFILAASARDIGNSASVVVPPGYQATVSVTSDGTLGTGATILPAADVLQISVAVSYNGGADSIVLEGYRTRYAPNGMP